MKVALLSLVILISCQTFTKSKEEEYRGFKERKIILSAYDQTLGKLDSFAIFSIKLPERFDTLYQFRNYPNIIRGSIRKYRVADSNYSLLEERNGLEYYLKSADSLYQLTISHLIFIPSAIDTLLKPLQFEDTSLLTNEIMGLEYSNDSIQYNYKKFMLVDGHPFVIASYRLPSFYKQGESKLVLDGITRIKKRELTIRAECDGKDTTGFIDNMYKSFLSIRIDEKQ